MPKKMVQEDSAEVAAAVDAAQDAVKRDVLASVLAELESMVTWGDEKYNDGIRAAAETVRRRLAG